ncbi:hypothetical protein [Endozoicomonas lisbonensis]|uniref:Glycoamylase-like domain-containing protein n=3 Tax=Endozoicomonas lisbonensis TaxID=3120522 RepID=A0ABV2SDI8_9GAMM
MKKILATLVMSAALSPMASAIAADTTMTAQPVAAAEITDSEIIEKLFKGSYKFWQQARNDNGSYEDKLYFEHGSNRGSIANSGMGLIALAIGHEMGWEPDAEELALVTLRMLAGKGPDISVPRNPSNTYIHFYDTRNGEQIGVDWSPIDSAIMLCGALFIKRYFPENREIATLVDELYETTDLTQFIADINRGQIYLVQDDDGNNMPPKTKAFNEYMIVAALANQQAIDFKKGRQGRDARRFWNHWYETPKNLPVSYYNDIPVLSEGRTWFTSKFNFLFNHYLLNGFSASEEYQQASANAARADYSWFQSQGFEGMKEFEWGSGAGSCPDGYCVDRIVHEGIETKNPHMMISPTIIAGFIPHSERAKDDLIAMYRDDSQKAVYELPEGGTVLWRYSKTQPEWRSNAIEGVDFSTMLFGLASLPEYLGTEFFNAYNDYSNPEPANYTRPSKVKLIAAE